MLSGLLRQIPKFDFVSNVKPSLFAYPSLTKPPKKETVTKVATAVLSTTAKVKAREKRKAAAEGEIMDVVSIGIYPTIPQSHILDKDVKAEPDADVEMKAEEPSKNEDASPINRQDESKASTSRLTRRAEPSFEIKPNFSRVTPAQLQFISFPSDGRYQPVRSVSSNVESQRMGKGLAFGSPLEGHVSGGGILILADLRPDQNAQLIEFEPPAPPQAITQPPAPLGANGHAIRAQPTGPHIALDENAPEADPPEPFEVWFFFSLKVFVLTS